ncbi:ABC transporter ATP-binding protein [Geomonas sp. Red69]|uniref:ABC transporter ATP-binding protein n=1 Tax=Geomonas diazotrophica TaxID=2843197 RepID=A0ABX8JHB6_9BACT|nr:MULTISPECIES: ABC transporter ATP-binding protein [Geomonas]MBU5638774.1 ABC transporter ATP-binding protein [Geomonas diazotrophica]QWV97386.1 ABC transporter ATP-binding protein [Geomonas nitrogeniifigens]QXE86544.1 ABC transporter ATP-binding protein [Geomonas nitrogeniifigens]
MTHAITLHDITKSYDGFTAVDEFSLEVQRGTVFGLLGPNGAGKTTLIKILTTLMRPTLGDAFVEGHSVLTAGKEVRRMIGVVPQENNLDRYLTARENLALHAKLHGMRPAAYNPRIDELLDMTGLAARQYDFPDTFSGGMQRRLVVARALVHEPRVLFLDEPTTGLDPQSRRSLWDHIRGLRRSMTVFLTTHYMDEADALCDRIMIMDHGKTLADGTAGELKDAFSRAHTYQVEFRRDADRYQGVLAGLPFVKGVERDGSLFQITLADEESIKPLMDHLTGPDIRRICLKEPTLEDVFISLTGEKVRE